MKRLSKDSLNSKYNDDPVYYCKSCLSLWVEALDAFNPDEGSYCRKCGRTDIDMTDIMSYREMYKEKYGMYPEE